MRRVIEVVRRGRRGQNGFSGIGEVVQISEAPEITAADSGKAYVATEALNFTLPAASTLPSGFSVILDANGGAVTVTSVSDINGSASDVTIPIGNAAIVYGDATEFFLRFYTNNANALALPLAISIGGTGGADVATAKTNLGFASVTGNETIDGIKTFTLAPVFTQKPETLQALGLTATAAELNLLDGKSIVTEIGETPTDAQIPTAQAVNARPRIAAWVRFVGSTGAVTAGSDGVTVTRNAPGDYTIDFTGVGQDFSALVTPVDSASGNGGSFCSGYQVTQSQARVFNYVSNSGGNIGGVKGDRALHVAIVAGGE